MPELQPQDVTQTTSTIASRSTPNITTQFGQNGARRPQRATSAKYYNIATSILSNDIDDLFLAAARDGEYEKIEHILQRRGDVVVSLDVKDKRTGNTPLMWAAKKGHAKIVQILLKHGADPTLHNYEDLCALEMATSNIKTILLDSVEKTTESSHRLLLQAAWQGNIKVVKKLLSQNKVLDINCQNAEGLSPLLLVARDIQLFERLSVQLHRHYNPIEVAQELLNHRADIHMEDNDGKTCLHYSCLSRATISTDLVENLIQFGAQLENRDKRHFTPIHLASHSGNHGIITALLDGGSEVNSQGFLGLTPLHITSQQDHQRAAMVLLRNGADVTLVDHQGKSPVDLAKSKKMKSTLKEAWTEATQKKITPNLAPVRPPTVRAPSRDDCKSQKSKRRKGEVIFDGLVASQVQNNIRPTVTRSVTTVSNSDKARRAEEQMLKDLENGTFTHMPNVKEGMKRLTAMRVTKSTSLPKVSNSMSPPGEGLLPESPGRRASHAGENIRCSLEDGRNLITSPRLPATCKPMRHSTSSSIEDLELCVTNNRVSPTTLSERKKIKTHHRSESDPFTSPTLSDLTCSYDNILHNNRARGRTRSESSNLNIEDYEDDCSPSRLLRTPLDREITVLNIPTTIPESLSPSSTENTTVMYLDMNKPQSSSRPITSTSHKSRESQLLDSQHNSKDSSPRSDEEVIMLSRSGSLRLSYTNPMELLRSRSILKEEFILEESRPRDSLIQSSGSDPLSSAASSMSSSPRDLSYKYGLSASSKLPGIDTRVTNIVSSGKSSIKRSRSFTHGQRSRLTNQMPDPSYVQSNERISENTDKINDISESAQFDRNRSKSFRRDKVLKPMDTNSENCEKATKDSKLERAESVKKGKLTIAQNKLSSDNVKKDTNSVNVNAPGSNDKSELVETMTKTCEPESKIETDKDVSDHNQTKPKPTAKDFKVSFSSDKSRDCTSAKSRLTSAKSVSSSFTTVSSKSQTSTVINKSSAPSVRASVPSAKSAASSSTQGNRDNKNGKQNPPKDANQKDMKIDSCETQGTPMAADKAEIKQNKTSSKAGITVSKQPAQNVKKAQNNIAKSATVARTPKVSIPSTNRTTPKKVKSAASLKVMSLGIKSCPVVKAASSASVSNKGNNSKDASTEIPVDTNTLTNIENPKSDTKPVENNSAGSSKSGCSEKYRIQSAKSQKEVPAPKPSQSLPRASSQTNVSEAQNNVVMPKSGRKSSAKSCRVSGIQVLLDNGTPTPGRNPKSDNGMDKNSGKSKQSDPLISKLKKKLVKNVSEPKEPLVRISVPGEEPKLNLSQQNMDEFLAEMHTPVIVNPFEDFVPCENVEPQTQPTDYTISKYPKDAIVKNRNVSKTRNLKSARKPKLPSSATTRQTSAGKKKGGKTKNAKNNSEDVRPKSGRPSRSAKKSGKKTKKGATLAEHAAKPDVALISGIGWQLVTGCLDNRDVKVASFIGSDSDPSDIYDDLDLCSEKDLSPEPCNDLLNLESTPRFADIKIGEGLNQNLSESPDHFPPMKFEQIHDFQRPESPADLNSAEFNEITANLHREILRSKMTPIPESPGSSLVSKATSSFHNHDNKIYEEFDHKSSGSKSGKSSKSKGQIKKGKIQESQISNYGNHDNQVDFQEDENIDQVIDEILNFNTSTLNSTLRSNKSMRSANSTLTESDMKILQELRKPVAGFHAKTTKESDDSDDTLSIEDETRPKVKVTRHQSLRVKAEMDEEAKEIAKVVRTFGHLELHAGGSMRSLSKRSPRRDLIGSPRHYGSINTTLSTNRKPPSGKFHEVKPIDESTSKKISKMDQFNSPEEAVFEQLQEVVNPESIVQSLAEVIKESDPDLSQMPPMNRLSYRRGSGSSSACTSDSLSSTNDLASQWKKGNILGKGAFGTVYCGLTNEGELIAVKQIELNSMDKEKAQREYEKVQEEVELLKNLKHKNIVGYLGTSFEDSIVSIFMQFVPGGSLASVLARFGALDESVFRRYTRQILEGVEYLHENEVIHRDIKGGNVMLMPNGIIKLIDFGCAKRLCFNLSMSQTQILKSMKGTPYWMAPEVVSETGHGKKSDIWSIGCTVFEMATRKPPWSNMNPMAAIFAIGSDKPVPQLSDSFSILARQFVNACLTRDQNERPSATELLSHQFIVKKPASRK